MNIGSRRIWEFESVRPTVSITWRPGRARLPGWIRAGLGIGVIGVQMAKDCPLALADHGEFRMIVQFVAIFIGRRCLYQAFDHLSEHSAGRHGHARAAHHVLLNDVVALLLH